MTNTGIEMPVIDRPMRKRSKVEPWRNAAVVPAPMPSTSASSMAMAPSCNDSGNALPISSLTV